MLAWLVLAWAPVLAPGAVEPGVTPATQATTICRPAWLAGIRPPKDYTEAIKRKLFRAQKAPGRLGDYELDHGIPLGLGGCARCPENLWLQPRAAALRKDREETALHHQVCAGTLSLDRARATIRQHWLRP